jgi:transposase
MRSGRPAACSLNKRQATPRAGGERQALQALVSTREGAVNAKRAGLCQLRDLLITTSEPMRSELRPLTRARLLQRLATTRPTGRRDPELRGSLLALRSIARRVLALTAEELARQIETINRRLAPQLLAQPGVGPHAAAQLVLSWSHRGRITSEAAFARLAGGAPIPASSGKTIRYRLDRSRDRKLNRAPHMILITRKRTHPATIAYIERRLQEGKTRREATAASSATSPATSTGYSTNTERQCMRQRCFYKSQAFPTRPRHADRPTLVLAQASRVDRPAPNVP